MIFGEEGSQPNPQGRPPQQQQIQVDASTMEAVYANFFAVTGGQDEVTIYIGSNFQLPGMPAPAVKLTDRIILLPANAKRLLQALEQTVRAHEDRYGPIELPPAAKPPGQK